MKRWGLYAVIGVWFVGVTVAFAAVWSYKTTPGAAAEAPHVWPADSKIQLAAGVPNLVMFAHPQCPCTRASVAELARLASELGPEMKVHVVIVRPAGAPADFDEGVIAERVAAIAGAEILVDDGGVEAARFGAITSGSTVLYTPARELAFHGGITTARGHEGSGPATEAIRNIVRTHARTAVASPGAAESITAEAPTFGCGLTDPEFARK